MQSKKKNIGIESHKILLIDIDNCVRCHACEVACWQENNLKLCQVVIIEPRWINNKLHMDFVPIVCFQCKDPICLHSCPVDAISKRDDDIVSIDKNTCNGCKICVDVCPFGMMFFDEGKSIASKCDLCANRIDFGMEPSCVQHCIGGALQFLPYKELKKVTNGEHVLRIGKICYTSSKWVLRADI